MKEKVKKVDFDLSKLSLEELIKLNEEIVDFLEFLENSKIEQEEQKEDKK